LLPGFDDLSAKIATAQSLFDQTQKLAKDGTDIPGLQTMIRSSGGKNTATLSKVLVKADTKKQAEEIIQKEQGFSGTYMEWLNQKILNLSELQKQSDYSNRILGEIVPTFTNLVGNSDVFALKAVDASGKAQTDSVINNRIELTRFIRYFEENWLKKYSLDSTSKIGIGSVEFKATK